MTTTPDPLLETRGLAKRFAGVAALADASVAVAAGSVHALVGENGAGKSTWIQLVTGALAPDGGELRWRGTPRRFAGPQQALDGGIAVVHQEPQLVLGMSALDNLYLGRAWPTVPGTPWLARRRMRDEAQAACAALGLDLGLSRPAGELSATERVLLALVRSLARDPALLVLDEPTAAFTGRDADRLLATLDALRRRGMAIVYVSHRLDEVLRIADRVTVLRNGRTVADCEAAGLTQRTLIAAMSGRGDGDAGHAAAATGAAPGPVGGSSGVSMAPPRSPSPPLLIAEAVASADGRVVDVSLDVAAGEIVAVYGLAGAGRSALLELLAGVRPLAAGQVRSWDRDGRPHAAAPAARRREAAAGVRAAMHSGRVLIPSDRRGQALVLSMRLRENLTLPRLHRFARAGFVRRGAERNATVAAMGALDVRAAGPEQPVVELSGGNQQKLVFARALGLGPDLLLCDEPTQAVDPATREALHALLRAHCAAGGGVLLASSDLAETLALSQRVVVLRGGRSVATLTGPELRADEVLRHCFGAGGDAAGGGWTSRPPGATAGPATATGGAAA